MSFPPRPLAFVLAASNHGMMIVNRNDYCAISENHAFGVGHQILNSAQFDMNEIEMALAFLTSRRKNYGDGVFAIDGGANIGVHTIEWARHMHGWGRVLSFEAQEPVYYALAGNVALNNCMNATVRHSALGEACGELHIPVLNPHMPASYGSLELRPRETPEYIGQNISYAPDAGSIVPMVAIDSLNLQRLDFFKLDVEAMEVDVLNGAKQTIEKHKPIMLVEVLKSKPELITGFLHALGYKTFHMSLNIIAMHESDPALAGLREENGIIHFSY
jgi:FkbM family methyltransferase